MELTNKENSEVFYSLLNGYQDIYDDLIKPVLDSYKKPTLLKVFFKKKVNHEKLLEKTYELYEQLVGVYSELNTIVELTVKLGESFTKPIILQFHRIRLFIYTRY